MNRWGGERRVRFQRCDTVQSHLAAQQVSMNRLPLQSLNEIRGRISGFFCFVVSFPHFSLFGSYRFYFWRFCGGCRCCQIANWWVVRPICPHFHPSVLNRRRGKYRGKYGRSVSGAARRANCCNSDPAMNIRPTPWIPISGPNTSSIPVTWWYLTHNNRQ